MINCNQLTLLCILIRWVTHNTVYLKYRNKQKTKKNIMKAQIHIDGKVIFTSNKISNKNLEKKENELKNQYGCLKMSDIVKREFNVFTS